MQARQEPYLERELLLPTGLFLITEDELSVASYISDALQQMGARTAMIATSTLRSPEQLASVVDQHRQISGPVTGIVHLAPLAAVQMPDTLSEWRQYTQIQSKSLFQLLQLCAADLQQAGQQQQGWVLAASLFGGHFGRDSHPGPGLPTGGSSTGLLKTLITEWPGVQAKAIDFDTSVSPADIAQRLIKELLLPGRRVEIGYPQGNRTIFPTVPAPLERSKAGALVRKDERERSFQPLIPSADWVVLVTGGARGITSEIASEIVIPGMTLVVVGLSPEPAEESPATTDITEIGELRRILLEQARSQGLSPTPMQIERQLRKLLRDRVIRRNLERFRQTGAKFEYLPVDVRNAEEFGSLIEGIYTRYGRLDAVIHGAGIIEDKLIIDKTLASFDRVFDTKVDSTFILSRYLRPDSLKALILFGSVAGCYGNRGQSDYAAANEVMNRLACQMNAHWANTRVVAINWGPWDTTGMASEEVKRQFRERGIIPIPLPAGRQFFVDELCYGLKGESNVVAGDGPWASDTKLRSNIVVGTDAGTRGRGDAQKMNGLRMNATWYEDLQPGQQNSNRIESAVSELKGFVFLSSQPQLQPNSTVTLEHTFSLASDPYLYDHCLEGKPVLPATGALEWMAEFVQAAWSEWTVAEVRDLKVMRGLVLETEVGRNVLFSARASSHADSDSLQVAVEIVEPDRKIPFYRASVILRPQLEESPTFQLTPLGSGTSLDPIAAYRDYLFHGDRFQLVTSINRLNEQGIDAWVRPSQPTAWVKDSPLSLNWLFDPGLVDTAPQLAIIWDRVQRGSTALPSRLGAVVRYGRSPLNGPMQLALRVKSASEYTLVYDAVFLDETGKVRLHLMDIESTSNPALNRLADRI